MSAFNRFYHHSAIEKSRNINDLLSSETQHLILNAQRAAIHDLELIFEEGGILHLIVKTRSYSDQSLVLKLNELKSEPLKALFFEKIYQNPTQKLEDLPFGTMVYNGKADIISRITNLKSILSEFINYQHEYCERTHHNNFFRLMDQNQTYNELYLNFAKIQNMYARPLGN
jgi:hypothetical protein